MIFEDVIGAYLAAKKQERGESMRDHFSFKWLYPYFSGRDICTLKRHDVRAYITHRQAQGVKLSTVRRELRLFCAAINFVNVEFDLMLPNPVSRLSLSTGELRVRWITRQEAARLLLEAERHARRPHLPVFIRLRTASVVVALPCKTYPIRPPSCLSGKLCHQRTGLNMRSFEELLP